MGDDLGRAETTDAGRKSAADIAEADDPDGVTGDPSHGRLVATGRARVVPPLAFAGGGDGVVQAAGQRQQHGDRVVSHLRCVDAGHVARQDTEFRCRVEIDGVHANTHAADHLELRAGLHDGAAGQRHHADLRAVGIVHQFDEVLGAAGAALYDLEAGCFEQVDAVVGTRV